MTFSVDFIQEQLRHTGWAPIHDVMAKRLCPDITPGRDFSAWNITPSSLQDTFKAVRLFKAQSAEYGTVLVVARSALFLAERMDFLGFPVSAVVAFDPKAVVPRLDDEPPKTDPVAISHAGVKTKEPPRSCHDCGNLTRDRGCRAVARGEVPGAPADYQPNMRQLRKRLGYIPPNLCGDDEIRNSSIYAHDARTGRQLWPEVIVALAAVGIAAELAEGASVIEQARELITAMLANGPCDASEVIAAAEGANISARTIQRAADALGVVKVKSGFAGGWSWAMPSLCPSAP